MARAGNTMIWAVATIWWPLPSSVATWARQMQAHGGVSQLVVRSRAEARRTVERGEVHALSVDGAMQQPGRQVVAVRGAVIADTQAQRDRTAVGERRRAQAPERDAIGDRAGGVDQELGADLAVDGQVPPGLVLGGEEDDPDLMLAWFGVGRDGDVDPDRLRPAGCDGERRGGDPDPAGGRVGPVGGEGDGPVECLLERVDGNPDRQRLITVVGDGQLLGGPPADGRDDEPGRAQGEREAWPRPRRAGGVGRGQADCHAKDGGEQHGGRGGDTAPYPAMVPAAQDGGRPSGWQRCSSASRCSCRRSRTGSPAGSRW